MHVDPSLLTAKIRAALAPCSLGCWPTPLEVAPPALVQRLDALWLKREDRASPRYGGNKVRGLEFLLAGAALDNAFVTGGATGSTHCLATAIHARALGCHAVLALFPQPDSESGAAVERASRACAALVVAARSRASFVVALARAWVAAGRLGRRRWVALGGAHPRAVLGHALATLELAGQLAQPPEAIVVPLGSGGTLAGVLLGVAQLGWPTRVVGVRVAPALVANRWRVVWLARAAARVLERQGVPGRPVRPLDVPLVLDGLGRGYGHPTAAGEAARRRAGASGLLLDSTYGAKAFAALPLVAARGFRRVVFWHTFAAPPGPGEPPP